MVVIVAGADPGLVLTVVGVTDRGGAVLVSVVVVGADGDCVGGTSVDVLQICAYDGLTAGGGSLGPAGSSVWNLQPSTSSAGLETECSAGPSSA